MESVWGQSRSVCTLDTYSPCNVEKGGCRSILQLIRRGALGMGRSGPRFTTWMRFSVKLLDKHRAARPELFHRIWLDNAILEGCRCTKVDRLLPELTAVGQHLREVQRLPHSHDGEFQLSAEIKYCIPISMILYRKVKVFPPDLSSVPMALQSNEVVGELQQGPHLRKS